MFGCKSKNTGDEDVKAIRKGMYELKQLCEVVNMPEQDLLRLNVADEILSILESVDLFDLFTQKKTVDRSL